MSKKVVLFTGGGGLLGGEFKNLIPDALFPSRREFDVTSLSMMVSYCEGKTIDTVIHAAAFTSPPKVDKNAEAALDTNIVGTSNVVKLCMKLDAKLVYISTDYVFRGDKGNYREDDPVFPVNKYAWSKLGGECAVRMYEKSIIVRTSFGPNEFPYDKAFVNQWTSREPVSVVAAMISRLLDTDFLGTIHVGGDRKSVYEYARRISLGKEIRELNTKDVSFSVPADTSLDVGRYKSLFAEKKKD